MANCKNKYSSIFPIHLSLYIFFSVIMHVELCHNAHFVCLNSHALLRGNHRGHLSSQLAILYQINHNLIPTDSGELTTESKQIAFQQTIETQEDNKQLNTIPPPNRKNVVEFL